ncbi:uncharacterized protein B0T23DRAFT_25363 [Neurospora hispaniola]|uniref:Uncharacterized protein n=1 Tax=Neurospora hispaniola TaxID=588809 RepID=A0AAJ0IGF0_9PEZI|nr:hypothetical protein B0T23DRAFT_25363 [Neurospora hispaniola]
MMMMMMMMMPSLVLYSIYKNQPNLNPNPCMHVLQRSTLHPFMPCHVFLAIPDTRRSKRDHHSVRTWLRLSWKLMPTPYLIIVSLLMSFELFAPSSCFSFLAFVSFSSVLPCFSSGVYHFVRTSPLTIQKRVRLRSGTSTSRSISGFNSMIPCAKAGFRS